MTSIPTATSSQRQTANSDLIFQNGEVAFSIYDPTTPPSSNEADTSLSISYELLLKVIWDLMPLKADEIVTLELMKGILQEKNLFQKLQDQQSTQKAIDLLNEKINKLKSEMGKTKELISDCNKELTISQRKYDEASTHFATVRENMKSGSSKGKVKKAKGQFPIAQRNVGLAHTLLETTKKRVSSLLERAKKQEEQISALEKEINRIDQSEGDPIVMSVLEAENRFGQLRNRWKRHQDHYSTIIDAINDTLDRFIMIHYPDECLLRKNELKEAICDLAEEWKNLSLEEMERRLCCRGS